MSLVTVISSTSLYGRLTAVKPVCSVVRAGSDVTSGTIRSCGCLSNGVRTTHGKRNHELYGCSPRVVILILVHGGGIAKNIQIGTSGASLGGSILGAPKKTNGVVEKYGYTIYNKEDMRCLEM